MGWRTSSDDCWMHDVTDLLSSFRFCPSVPRRRQVKWIADEWRWRLTDVSVNWWLGSYDVFISLYSPPPPLYLSRGVRDTDHGAGTANQSVTINISSEQPQEWPPWFPHKLLRSNNAKVWWILNKTFKIRNGTCSLMTRGICCNQVRGKLHCYECWNQTQVVVHSTSQQSTTCWSDRKLVKTSPDFFSVLAVANTGSCVGPQNKIGHPAGCRFPCWVPAEYK